jgi:hypothetical protein
MFHYLLFVLPAQITALPALLPLQIAGVAEQAISYIVIPAFSPVHLENI